MILVVILIVRLLVVDMFNVIFLVSTMGFGAYKMGVSKTFLFFTCCTPGKFVPMSLQNVFRKLLVFNYIELRQRNGSTSCFAIPLR